MSLLFHRRTIARAVAGDLDPAAETRLRAHLVRCAACRRHYDALSWVAQTIATQLAQRAQTATAGTAPAGATTTSAATAGAASRERARLMAALQESPGDAREQPQGMRAWRWRAPLIIMPVLGAAAALLLLRPAPPSQPDEITYRGEATSGPQSAAASDSTDARASLALRFYARRRTPGQPPGPVQLLGELPGSGELRTSRSDELQIAYAGLTAPRHLVLLARDDAGALTRLYPPPDSSAPTDATGSKAAPLPPSREPRVLGKAIDVGPLRDAKQSPTSDRLRITAIVSKAPIDLQRLDAALRASPPEGATSFEGVLWIDP